MARRRGARWAHPLVRHLRSVLHENGCYDGYELNGALYDMSKWQFAALLGANLPCQLTYFGETSDLVLYKQPNRRHQYLSRMIMSVFQEQILQLMPNELEEVTVGYFHGKNGSFRRAGRFIG